MPTETYTPATAAVVLGVHANTVRAWTREYADVLSDSAQGRPRILTPRDVALLQHVAQLRADGLTQDAIIARLRDVPDADIQQPYIEATASSATPTETPTVPASPTADVTLVLREFSSLLDTRTADVTSDVRQLDARLRRLETRNTAQRGVLLGVLLGVAVGIVFGVLLAVLALQLFGV